METNATDNILVDLSKKFAVDIINICDTARKRGKAIAVIDQLLRSGTSIGANIHEANYASSKADFINKFHISLKETYETAYWLDVFCKAEIISAQEYNYLFNACSKIRKLLTVSITTAKGSAANK
ncbi:MAG: four helix bundle protein [Clostridia bacterium]|nr:four helix bundle protein [Clostridia bacterium]